MWGVETEEENEEEVIKIQEKPFSPLDGHTYSVNYVEFSPCGTMLASCSLDGTTLVWNTEVNVTSIIVRPIFNSSFMAIFLDRSAVKRSLHSSILEQAFGYAVGHRMA